MQFGEPLMNARDLVAGIDDDGLAGLCVAQQSAVALQRTDGERFQDQAGAHE